MPRPRRRPGPALLPLVLLFAACHGQSPDIEAPPPEPADLGSEAGGDEAAEPPPPADASQPPAEALQPPAAQPLAAAPEEEEQAQEGEEQEEAEGEAAVLQAAAAAASGADDAPPPDAEPAAMQRPDAEPAGAPPAEAAEPAGPAEAEEAEPSADTADASDADGITAAAATDAAGAAGVADAAEPPLPSEEPPLQVEEPAARAAHRPALAEVRARPGPAEGEEEALGLPPGLGRSALGRSIADGLGRAMTREMAGGGAAGTRGLVRRFMQNFARNMKYAVLTDSKGDMPEEERLRQLHELERHQSPEERRQLLRAIGEDPEQVGMLRRRLALASAGRHGGYRHRLPLPELRESVLAGEQRAERARQRLRMLNGGSAVPARRHLQMLNAGAQGRSWPEAPAGCEEGGCPGASPPAAAGHGASSAAAPPAQRAPPLLALGGARAPEPEGLLQRWRSSLSEYVHESVSLIEKPGWGRSTASRAFSHPLLSALTLAAVSLVLPVTS